MSYIENGITIIGDTNERMMKIIDFITSGIVNGKQKRTLFAVYAGTEEFLNYVRNNSRAYKDLSSLNELGNDKLKYVLETYLPKYYREKHPSVNDTIITNKVENKELEFSSPNAKQIAIKYCANFILRNRNLNDKEFILSELKDHIKDIFNNKVNDIIHRINNYGSNKEKEFATKITNAKNEFFKLVEEHKQLIKNKKKLKIKEEIDNITKQIKELEQKIINQKINYYALSEELINKYGTVQDNNIKIMFLKSKNNTTNFLKEVTNNPLLYQIKNQLSKETEDEKLENDNNLDIDDVENNNTNDIDETAKSWSQSIHKTYTQVFGGRLKLYLSTIPHINNALPLDTKIAKSHWDINNEMGLPTYMDANEICGLLATMTNKSSVDDMIQSIYELSRDIPNYYGLVKIAQDMKSDRAFANQIYHEISNPRIDKAMAIVNNTQFEFRWSNRASDYVTNLIYNLLNSARSTYKQFYNIEDRKKFQNYLNDLTDVGLGIYFTKNEETEMKQEIIKIISNFFPQLDKNGINLFLDRTNRQEKINNYNKIISHILTLFDSIEQVIKSEEQVNDEYYNGYTNEAGEKVIGYKEWKENNRLYMEYPDLGTYNVDKPVRRYENIKFDKLYKACIEIANDLAGYQVKKFDLNSVNAEGNLASDLINNSYITNLLQQIEYGTPENENKGLEDLRDFICQGHQYDESPLFFGVKDETGRVIREGLFIKYPFSKPDINPNAKEMIHFMLFDGAKNEIDGKAVMYNRLNSNDYLITQLRAFLNPTNTNNVKLNNISLGGYFLRTPSDAPKNFIIQTNRYKSDGTFKGEKTEAYYALYNNLLGELKHFVYQLENIFKYNIETSRFELNEDTTNLIEKIHFQNKKGKITFTEKDSNGNIILSGNVFKFFKLFTTNGYDASSELMQSLSLYGGVNSNALLKTTEDGKLILNTEHPIIDITDKGFKFTTSNELSTKLMNVLDNWIKNYYVEVSEQYEDNKLILDNNEIDKFDFEDWALNTTINYMLFDDLLEGDIKQYGGAREALKRAKEVQQGGKVYSAFNLNDGIDTGIKSLEVPVTIENNRLNTTDESLNDMTNGWRAITIRNNRKTFSNQVEKIRKELISELSKEYSPEISERLANEIAMGYGKPTAVDDAQSYITFEEFIRRRFADGTINEYKSIIEDIFAVRRGEKKISDINLRDVAARVQVQKNFYFDKVYHRPTQMFYNRQIKNAEFVLIPELLQGTELLNLYNIMKKNNIAQVNTEETSKAARRDVIEIWDGNGKIKNDIDIIDESKIENYYYRFLYKQQEVPEHMKDAKNKAGVQIMKKIADNASEEVQPLVDEFFDLYAHNIQECAESLLSTMNWKMDEFGEIVDKNTGNTLSFTEFYKRFVDEAVRLGMNSNFIDAITPNEHGVLPIPMFMNVNSTKQESIAQSMFNSIITRQTLPGWHAAQVSSVGHGVMDSNGQWRKLEYHPEVTDENGNVITKAYAEVMIPRWSNLIHKDYPIEKLEKEGLDIQIAYRIPTEGKQSIALFKVVGFLDDIYGSTVLVPDEWVVQTGSKFKIDSIYAICHAIYKDGDTIKKIKYDDDITLNESTKIRYINRIKTIIDTKLSRNSFATELESSDIKEIRNKLDNLFKDRKNNLIRELKKEFVSTVKKLNKDDIKDVTVKLKLPNKYTAYKELLDIFTNRLSNEQYKEEFDNYNKLIYNLTNLINVLDFSIVLHKDTYEHYNKQNDTILSKLYLDYINDYFELIEKGAEILNLDTFEDFYKRPILEQNSMAQRSSRMLDLMIQIMEHESSKEENYSRSNFEDIVKAIESTDNLRGYKESSLSSYNPFNQILFMENAMSGAVLKAFSVTQDTFCSISNRVHGSLSEINAIRVKYDLSEYNEEIIKASYGKDIKTDNNSIIINHTRLGWSNNNRNVVGKLITAYSSQTTAHILDAIKSGTIFNENTYTFSSFKTLINLGIDYDTAVKFLAQPAISRILDVQKTKESVYKANNVNIIKKVLTDLYNEANPDNKIEKSISYDSLYKLLNNDEQLNKKFEDIFGITIENAIGTPNLIVIDNKLLSKRLQNNDKNTAYDLGIVLLFNKIKNIADGINNITQCLTVDKFGAKQTIRSTRKIYERIIAYQKPTSIVGNLILTPEGNILDSVYPSKNGVLNVSKSKYKSLCAFMKYSTNMSYKINSQLFEMENSSMAEFISRFEKYYGKEFTDKEYKEFKQYLISNIYKQVPLLNVPITLDANNRVIPDVEIYNEIINANVDPHTQELYRIFGYETHEMKNLKINDLNNPTEEELKSFKLLTPAQKVLFIQQRFGDNKGLFGLLEVNIFNNREYKKFGYTSQVIKFNDNDTDIENLFIEYRNAFYNNNKLVRLAAIDLIKYAFLVEGYKFKKGAISKILTNETLYSNIEDLGVDIIDYINAAFRNYRVYTNEEFDKLANNFIRSHQQIAKTVYLGKPPKKCIL